MQYHQYETERCVQWNTEATCEDLANGKSAQRWPPVSPRDCPDKTCAVGRLAETVTTKGRVSTKRWRYCRGTGRSGCPSAGRRCSHAPMRGPGSSEPSQETLDACIHRALRRQKVGQHV